MPPPPPPPQAVFRIRQTRSALRLPRGRAQRTLNFLGLGRPGRVAHWPHSAAVANSILAVKELVHVTNHFPPSASAHASSSQPSQSDAFHQPSESDAFPQASQSDAFGRVRLPKPKPGYTILSSVHPWSDSSDRAALARRTAEAGKEFIVPAHPSTALGPRLFRAKSLLSSLLREHTVPRLPGLPDALQPDHAPAPPVRHTPRRNKQPRT